MEISIDPPYPVTMDAARAALPVSATSLMAGVVDYAGLFPPAALSMRDALTEYAAAAQREDALLLGRFVVPAARIAELREHAGIVPSPLHLSALVTDRSESDIAAVKHCDGVSLIVDALECKAKDLGGIDWLADATDGSGLDIYVELDPSADLTQWFDRLAARKLRAKIRTGGTTAAAFPTPAAIARFMKTAIDAHVPFKATAGLHHAVRGNYRLTYQPDAPEAVMYGYLNVLLAAAALRAGRSSDAAEQVLQLTDRSTLHFDHERIRWGAFEWPVSVLQTTRTDDLIGFGSCSISEPAEEIRALVSPARS